jgi:hypothetical protein
MDAAARGVNGTEKNMESWRALPGQETRWAKPSANVIREEKSRFQPRISSEKLTNVCRCVEAAEVGSKSGNAGIQTGWAQGK